MASSSMVWSTDSVGVPNQKEFTETMRSDINQSDSRLPQIDHWKPNNYATYVIHCGSIEESIVILLATKHTNKKST